MRFLALGLCVLVVNIHFALSCTNILVTPSASSDGNALIGDNDDSSARFGALTHFAAGNWPDGATRQIYDFETGVYRGEILQPKTTLNVMRGGNEHGVVIAESTFGGLSDLHLEADSKILDYGSLITATLQRAKSAREAIHIIDNLTATYGYSSTGESFSISDGKETWHMELIGRGIHGAGILYVAMRVPEGYIGAHANQARITTYIDACSADSNQCLASPDLLEFAINYGYYNCSGPNCASQFSYSDTFDPVTVNGARFCEARVWYIFSQLADPSDFNATQYLDYAQGFNLTNRMPLFVLPKQGGINRLEVHAMMSAAFQGSWFDPSLDVGAGAEHSPKRWNGLTWPGPNGDTYLNERIVGTQATSWHFVAELNASEPLPMRALLWFGVDDHTWAPKVPIYGGATGVHRSYDDANCSARVACRQYFKLPGSMMDFTWEAAFWVNSAVAQMVYAATDRAAPIVVNARAAFEAHVAPQVEATQETARASFARGDYKGGVFELTSLAKKTTAEAHDRWTKLWQQLMVANMDGYSATPNPNNLMCGCQKTAAVFTPAWGSKVIADTGDHYRFPGPGCAYIDPDGHCHDSPPSNGCHTNPNANAAANLAKTIPKHLVSGVLP